MEWVNVLAVSYLAETQEIPRNESYILKEVVSETEEESMSRNYMFWWWINQMHHTEPAIYRESNTAVLHRDKMSKDTMGERTLPDTFTPI